MPKYIRIASDLHLETVRQDVLPRNEKDSESILILAGDISSNPSELVKFLTACSERFEHIIAIPGNHEFYGQNMPVWKNVIKDAVAPIKNVYYAEDAPKSIVLEGVKFIFGILWADGGKTAKDHQIVAHSLNDFYVIRNGDSLFKVPDMIQEHKLQKKIINEMLHEPFDGKKVVITHHLPSYRLVAPRFQTSDPFSSGINGGFASICDDILAYEHAPNLWVHGHTHDSIDTKLWNTRIICNPSGYRHEHGSVFNQYAIKFISLDSL